MNLHRLASASILASVIVGAAALTGCGGAQSQAPSILPASATAENANAATTLTGTRSVDSVAAAAIATPGPVTHRAHFLGAFFRPQGAPPFGVFLPEATHVAPKPYPVVTGTGIAGQAYCNDKAANGMSITSDYPVDPTKLADAVNLGIGWTRMGAPQFSDDSSHVFGPGSYNFSDFDSAQCATLVNHGIQPVVGLAAGPIEYNATPGTFSPQGYAMYKTAADFGQWCGVVAAHEKSVFGVNHFSSPGNEVNTNEQLWPGGEAQMASYSEACYAAIKAANPKAFVYGFELNMDGNVNAPAFVARMYALGCKVGTCYDGIAMHLALRYPQPPAGTPCYPKPHGDYTVACISDVEAAAHAKVHVLISETQYPVPASVPDEQTKALAIVADFTTLSQQTIVDGVSYANVDECGFYPTGFWSGGCLIDTSGNILPAYTALQSMSLQNFQ